MNNDVDVVRAFALGLRELSDRVLKALAGEPVQPATEPQVQPATEPQVQPQPQVQPATEPQVQPQAPPQVQPPVQPPVQPQPAQTVVLSTNEGAEPVTMTVGGLLTMLGQIAQQLPGASRPQLTALIQSYGVTQASMVPPDKWDEMLSRARELT